MSDATFSLVTSMFTAGGFLGSSTANIAMERYGRKAALQISGLFVAIGSGLMAIAPSTFLLLLGRQYSHSIAATSDLLVYRFLTGCGAGIGLCTGPVFLAEIAPQNIRGSVGKSLGSIYITYLITGNRCSHTACHSIGHHDYPTTWFAYGNPNSMEICVIIFLRRLGRAVMSEPVHCRVPSVAEAEWKARRFPCCSKGSLPGTRYPEFIFQSLPPFRLIAVSQVSRTVSKTRYWKRYPRGFNMNWMTAEKQLLFQYRTY
jgi:MFS family permease